MALWGLKMIETFGVLGSIFSGSGGAYLFKVCLFITDLFFFPFSKSYFNM